MHIIIGIIIAYFVVNFIINSLIRGSVRKADKELDQWWVEQDAKAAALEQQRAVQAEARQEATQKAGYNASHWDNVKVIR